MPGNDGSSDNGVIIELKAWETADVHEAPEMAVSAIAGGSVESRISEILMPHFPFAVAFLPPNFSA
jgi:hypothetical protein